ncbi:LysR family transcriptional regulator [Sporosarcina saromensis]|uniref:LysR family transcriptional regulator n=1 Tax=Sporosarcina saromensis TaxID=359365 RepID=A0ABU4GDJ8_9BACL|nr:LysR family transcriptional regulator [Sporosarcina saromensis]MDW0114413.1 LysR family transcriptional regulator [Sporosarcina saromensis]
MEIRQLMYFIAVAEELHFGRAAKRLGMTQPPLSQQIFKLEEYLEVKLFHRTKRKVVLTEAGHYFYKESVKINRNLHSIIQNTKLIDNGMLGTLKIGFGPDYGTLTKILKIYEQHHPNVQLQLEQMPTAEQLMALEKKEIHIGLLPGPIKKKNIESNVVAEHPYKVALPISHPLAKEVGGIDLQQLKDENFIMTPREIGPAYYDTIINICNTAGFHPHISKRTHELQTIIPLIAANMGIAIVPELVNYFNREEVVFLPIKNCDITMKNCIAWNVEARSPMIDLFIELVKSIK